MVLKMYQLIREGLEEIYFSEAEKVMYFEGKNLAMMNLNINELTLLKIILVDKNLLFVKQNRTTIQNIKKFYHLNITESFMQKLYFQRG